jgi:hypothetical protein
MSFLICVVTLQQGCKKDYTDPNKSVEDQCLVILLPKQALPVWQQVCKGFIH